MLLLYGWIYIYREREREKCFVTIILFRIGVSQINVHRYRFSQTADYVLCSIGCAKSDSELHLLFQCPVYVQLRNQYLPALCEQNEDRKFVDRMQSESKETILRLAIFMFFAFS